MADFLLELRSEDIPARMQARAAEDLARLVTDRLTAAGLAFSAPETFVTPRRLALALGGLPSRQPDVRDERKGPRVGAPQAAIDGFLRSAGVASLDACTQRDTGKGVFWFAVIDRPGRPTANVLAEIIAAVVAEFPWPKAMRWGAGTLRWVRPLQGIVALLDGMPVPGAITVRAAPDGGSLGFGATTVGHRFLAPAAITLTTGADYRAQMAAARVVVDRAERRARIVEAAAAAAAAVGLSVVDDPGLVDEVTGLVEWPVVHVGTIDPPFMALPPEVLTTSMRTHQKYFATEHPDGRLAPRFIVVANTETDDGGAAVVAGNERVLRARLSDARFFWDQDRKAPLRNNLSALRSIVFHARLGTLFDKVTRLEALAGSLAARVPGCDETLARHAAILAKTDLVTGMVGEFPELQGLMGRYYALAGGEPAAVADALADHYRPLGPTDRCPTAPLSIAVALADKLDTLTGFFAIGEKPTGSKDPFALRRAGLGIIRLVLETRCRLGLRAAVTEAHGLYRVHGLAPAQAVADEVLAFLADRLKVVLRDRGVRHDLIDAAFAPAGAAPTGGEDDLVRLLARVEALGAFLASDDGANLVIAYRRASNIVRIEEKKDSRGYGDPVAIEGLAEPEERALAAALGEVTAAATPCLAAEDFAGAMAALARLRGPVDAFFDRVTVNVDDPALRANRLRLLSEIRATLNRVADFSRLEG